MGMHKAVVYEAEYRLLREIALYAHNFLVASDRRAGAWHPPSEPCR
jgi:hypothetical protein